MNPFRRKTIEEVREERNRAREERDSYRRSCNRVERELEKLQKEADSEIKDLRGSLGKLNGQHQAALSDLRAWKDKHEEALTQATMAHSREMESIRQQYHHREGELNRTYQDLDQHSKNEYRRIHREWEDKYQILEFNSTKRLQDTMKEHENQIMSLQISHADEVQVLRRQLLVPTDDNLGWADDKLKTNFRDLQRMIREVASPTHRQFTIPENERLPPHLDPTSVVERGGSLGRKRYHFVLQKIIWDIIQEQFFSVPFGFGALGPIKGKTTLTDFFLAWRELFDTNARSALFGDSGPSLVFQNDKLANKWRCATFIGIQSEISNAQDGPITKISVDNCKQTVERIVKLLTELSERSGKGNSLPSHFNDKVNEIAIAARDFGLQFGVHSAHLNLFSPSKGTPMVIGEECFHCANADSDAGDHCVVDTVVVPSLKRIGDGWSDMHTEHTITPCYILPQ